MTQERIGAFQVAFSRKLSIQPRIWSFRHESLSGREGWFTPAPTFAGLNVRVFTQALRLTGDGTFSYFSRLRLEKSESRRSLKFFGSEWPEFRFNFSWSALARQQRSW